MKKPSLLTFTVMKNEGPFILEWLAYQRLVGVDHIVVLTNDCDDGTDLILDRLDAMGLVRHLPNPCALFAPGTPGATKPHIVGIGYARQLREWREADYIFLSDVDEFPLVRVGDGSLKALLAKTDYPDVISMNEMLFGTSGQVHYTDSLITETFTQRSLLNPLGRQKTRRGLKSITRNKPGVLKIRNHRPTAPAHLATDLRWLDGSGRDFPLDLRHVHEKGTDCRDATELAVINHYTLRSTESFLVKMARGDAVAPERINLRYFRQRNRNEEHDTTIHAMLPRLKEEIERLKRDPHLADLHVQSVEAHKAKIAALRNSPDFAEILKRLNIAPAPSTQQAA
ncbi:MAG: glycosyltransferase family 2 protein [Rhodobacteraceae bacterium]|jgi:hypothetical protein|nr:glycosyltransferase family 2 protein [Paracoccaceae bacterium]